MMLWHRQAGDRRPTSAIVVLGDKSDRSKNARRVFMFAAQVISTSVAAGLSALAMAAVPIVDPQDTLDQAVSGPAAIYGSGGNIYNFSVGDQERYDDNVFRLSRDADIATTVSPSASKGDYISSPTAGGTAEWSTGRQIVDLNVNVQDNLYANNTYLNNVSTTDKVAWSWGVGGALSGQVGADYLRDLVSFVNTTSYTRLIYGQQEYFASLRYQIGPRIVVYAGILDAVFSLSGAQFNDSRSKSFDLGGELATNELNTFGLDYRYQDSRYPNTVVLETVGGATPFNPDFRQDRVRFLFKRTLTDKASLDVAVGYLKRTYGDSVIGAFSGPTWRGTVSWLPTEKTQVLLATWRDLQSYLTDQTNYYRATGVSLQPIWTPTEKVTASLTVSRTAESFIGSSVSAINEGSRTATINAQGLDVGYIPLRALTFDFSYRREQRDTNGFLRAYTDGIASASVKFVF